MLSSQSKKITVIIISSSNFDEKTLKSTAKIISNNFVNSYDEEIQNESIYEKINNHTFEISKEFMDVAKGLINKSNEKSSKTQVVTLAPVPVRKTETKTQTLIRPRSTAIEKKPLLLADTQSTTESVNDFLADFDDEVKPKKSKTSMSFIVISIAILLLVALIVVVVMSVTIYSSFK